MSTSTITASITGTLNTQELNQTRLETTLIGASAQIVVPLGRFVFFAAFDGTNNDRTQLELSGTVQSTNVAQLAEQFTLNNPTRDRGVAGYYAGIGTGDIAGGFAASSYNPTPAALAIANKAYCDFVAQAKLWLDADASRSPADITTAMTGFSRGCGSAVIFAQLLNERGLVLPDGTVLVAPGQVPVASTLLFDPVLTGIDRVLSLPPNVTGNVMVVQAQDEFRYMFRAADFSGDARVTTIPVYGNHGNIGGFYDNGIGALVLQGATQFFRNSGIAIGNVAPERQFDESTPPAVYSEGVDTWGKRIWSEYGTRGNRLLTDIPTSAAYAAHDPDVNTVNTIDNSLANAADKTKLVIVTDKSGQSNQYLIGADGSVLLAAGAGEQVARNTVTGTYSVTSTQTQAERSYDPVSGETTISSPGHATVVVKDRGIVRIIETTGGVPEQTVINGEVFYVLANGAPYRKTNGNTFELRDPEGNNGALFTVGMDGKATQNHGFARVVRPDGTVATDLYGTNGVKIGERTQMVIADDRTVTTSKFLDGTYQTLTTNADGTLYRSATAKRTSDGSSLMEKQFDATGNLISSTLTEYVNTTDGVRSRVTVTTKDGQTINLYDEQFNLIDTQTLPAPRPQLSNGQIAVTFQDLTSVINAIKAGKPLPILASGLNLLNHLDTNHTMQGLNGAAQVANGAMSFYNLYNAMQSGDGFAQLNATLSTVSFVNTAIFSDAGRFVAGSASGSLNTFLNGNGGLLNGSVGVLPALGLISAIQSGDPVGIASSIGTLINPGFLLTGPGMVLAGIQLLRALFSDNTPPKAWGTANVTFGEGITNYGATVNATGENFGPDRVRPQLQNLVDALASIAAQNNAATADSSQRIGIIPQRLPSLNFKANEFADKGYAIADIDPLTGAQRFANVRFDDQGQLFGIDPAAVTPELRAMLSLPGAPGYPGLSAYMLNAALQRGALAPMWEVQTAKMQQTAGDPNAGLSEEERAAKAGLAAALDTAYAAAHPNDVMAKTKRVGHFMPIGIDLDALNRSATGVGSVNTLSIAQTEASGHAINFDWDGSGYRKQTGWVGANDGFLVLDRNFNASVDSGAELLSNPLVADPAKGLRSLAAFDANGDGRIDALDPVYNQLKVWQDLDQDGNNTHTVTIGTTTALAQDEMGGKKELRSLAELGITAIDYSNSRYVFKSTSSPGGGGYGAVSTLKLEAKDEGVIYTPVRGGILITATDGKPEVLVTQVQSDAAVYHALALETAGETVHLSEDGYGAPRNPNQGDALVKLTVTAAQLLANDTWHGMNGCTRGAANEPSWRRAA